MAQELNTASSPAASPYGTLPPASPMASRKPISLPRLLEMHTRGEKITMLTAYDATFAAVADAAGVECILVGDSLGMVCRGLHSTVGVTLEDMRYHTESVARGAHMVKLEGGGWTTEVVRFLVERGIPVCAHLGLTPQTVHALGGYRVQGRGDAAAHTMKKHALELQDAGASMVVLEMVPAPLSAELTQELPHCATIGIGAGKGTAGQVLVLHDMLGVNLGKNPKFVRNFMADATSIRGAMEAYVAAVKNGSFPDDALHAW
jgi:3-methyl-2-oxobutanoate hydroxymethyltransferase